MLGLKLIFVVNIWSVYCINAKINTASFVTHMFTNQNHEEINDWACYMYKYFDIYLAQYLVLKCTRLPVGL